jgi:hypothetical protein
VSDKAKHGYEQKLDRMQTHLPEPAAGVVSRLRQRRARWIRIPVALLLIAGGIVGFLPVVGFWMLPVGVLLLAQDIPALRGPSARMIGWAQRSWSKLRRRWSAGSREPGGPSAR